MKKSTLAKLKPSVKLSIENPKNKNGSVFGRGIATLCQGVRDVGSLNAAAKSIGMAYSKAWRIIKDTESALGIDLLIRDGAHGSQLTKEGERLLDIYLELDKKLAEKSVELYNELNQ